MVKVILCVFLMGQRQAHRCHRVLCANLRLGRSFCGGLSLFACVGKEKDEAGGRWQSAMTQVTKWCDKIQPSFSSSLFFLGVTWHPEREGSTLERYAR